MAEPARGPTSGSDPAQDGDDAAQDRGVVAGALSGSPVRVPLPDSPQGEAIAFAGNDRDLLVCSEGLPAAVTLVPVAAAAAPEPAAETPGGDTADGEAAPLDLTRSVSPVTAGLIAAGVATVLVWTIGRFRRRS